LILIKHFTGLIVFISHYYVIYFEGMWSHALTVQNYQDMIDRGWRRYVHKKDVLNIE